MNAPPLRVRTVSSALVGPPVLVFDRAGVREVDRVSAEEFGLPGIALMENAAASLARVCLERLDRAADSTVLLVCGPGNNGGDGFACARRLHNAGVRTTLALLGEPRDPSSDAGVNLHIARTMRIECVALHNPAADLDDLVRASGEPALVVDAMLGAGLDRPLEGKYLDAVRWLNAQSMPVIAADIPSGLDMDSGDPLGQAVHAAVTVTFAGLKRGFLKPAARAYLGEVIVADIGAPIAALSRFGRPPEPGTVALVR